MESWAAVRKSCTRYSRRQPFGQLCREQKGGTSRIFGVVGIAIAGTMSAIAAELANKAAQAAASGKDEQPTEETVYVLNST